VPVVLLSNLFPSPEAQKMPLVAFHFHGVSWHVRIRRFCV